jgi:hypothetical protein
MRTFLIVVVLALLSVQLHAQGTYNICDTTEFCFCHDGSAAQYTYVFHSCLAGESIHLVICEGIAPPDVFMTVWNGPLGSPSFGTYSSVTPWDGISFVSTHPSGSLSLTWTYGNASEQSCANGDYPPIILTVFSAPLQALPSQPQTWIDCSNAGASCLTTGLSSFQGRSEVQVTYLNGALHFPGNGFTGEVEVLDLSGRVIERLRSQGEGHLAIMASLSSGVYVATFHGATGTSSQKFIVH